MMNDWETNKLLNNSNESESIHAFTHSVSASSLSACGLVVVGIGADGLMGTLIIQVIQPQNMFRRLPDAPAWRRQQQRGGSSISTSCTSLT
jgi:hypothetical protein